MRHRLGETGMGFRSTVHSIASDAVRRTGRTHVSIRFELGVYAIIILVYYIADNGTRVPPDNGGNSKG